MKVYLAGPDVFLPDAVAMGVRKRNLCRQYGLIGLYPLDNEIEPSAEHQLSRAIFEGNIRMIAEADVVAANLTPFRGVSADAGTVYEVGHAFALGKAIYGYSHDPASILARATAAAPRTEADGRVYAHDGLSVEDFGLADNLMILEAIAASGGRFIATTPGRERSWQDLDLFEDCLRLIAETRTEGARPSAAHQNKRMLWA